MKAPEKFVEWWDERMARPEPLDFDSLYTAALEASGLDATLESVRLVRDTACRQARELESRVRELEAALEARIQVNESTPAERRRLAIHAGAMALIAAQTERRHEMIEGKAFIRYESPSYEAAADISEGQMLEIERIEKENTK